jgi:hypothetical protein
LRWSKAPELSFSSPFGCVCVCVPPRRIIFSCPVLDWVSLWGFLPRWAAVLRHP